VNRQVSIVAQRTLGTGAQAAGELGDREREILKDVIVTYILSAEPVSSRSVARQSRLGLSAATIRNVMADLEEAGYLYQPHTSAGRVPTREGYHLFIDALMEARQLPVRERRYIDETLLSVPTDLQQLLAATVYLLKDLSHQVSIILTPEMGEAVLRAVEFVPVEGTKVLCVVVSDSGFVDNRLVDTETPLTREELTWISNYLTENFAGLSLRQIRERLLHMMAEERAQVDRLMSLSIDLARRGLANEGERQLIVEGASEILNQPELGDIQRVRQVFDTFSQKARLVSMLNQTLGTKGVRVLIGEDSDLTSQLDFSLIAASYRAGTGSLGSLAVFGPSRMEYSRLIPLVHYLGQALSRILAGTLASQGKEC
jgi:heat-inducible transcriptional repressor